MTDKPTQDKIDRAVAEGLRLLGLVGHDAPASPLPALPSFPEPNSQEVSPARPLHVVIGSASR